MRSDKQGSHSGISEDSVLFECEAVSTGKDRRFEGTNSLPLQYFRDTPLFVPRNVGTKFTALNQQNIHVLPYIFITPSRPIPTCFDPQ